MRTAWLLAAIATLSAGAATAEIVTATPASFEITQSVTINKPQAAVWDMLRSPQNWWDKQHTYSGDSANLYIDPQATGCFCEKLLGKGSVEHARIVFAQPPKLLRLQGSLGPLQAEAVTGTLTFRLAAEGDGATKVTLSYVVGGYMRPGGEALAPQVDEVMAVQLLGLKNAAEAVPDASLPDK